MSDNELLDVSVIIGFKDWGLDRLLLSLRALTSAFGECSGEVIVSDFGSANGPEIETAVTAVGARYHRTETDGSWSRSRAVNSGYAVANGRVLVATDADMLFSPSSMEIIAKKVLSDPNAAIVLQCRDLPSTHSSEHLVHTELDWQELETVSQIRPRWGMGGMFAATRERVGLVGGYDNRMHTYGGEDLDFAQRVRRSGAPVIWIVDPRVRMYHIWHPATIKNVEKSVEATAAVAANRAILKTDLSWKRNRERGPWTLPFAPPTVSVILRVWEATPYKDLVLKSLVRQKNIDFEVFVIYDSNDKSIVQSRQNSLDNFQFIVASSRLDHDVQSAISRCRSPFSLFLEENTILSDDALATIMANHTSDVQSLWAPVRLYSAAENDYIAPVYQESRHSIISGPTTGHPSIVVVSTKIATAIGLTGCNIIDIQRNILNDIEIHSGNIKFLPNYLGFAIAVTPALLGEKMIGSWSNAARYRDFEPVWDKALATLHISFPDVTEEASHVARLAPYGIFRSSVSFVVETKSVLSMIREEIPAESTWIMLEDANGDFVRFESEIPDITSALLRRLEEFEIRVEFTSQLRHTHLLSSILEPRDLSDFIVQMAIDDDFTGDLQNRLGVNAMAYGIGELPAVFKTLEDSELVFTTDILRTITTESETMWIWLRKNIGQLTNDRLDNLINILRISGIDVGIVAPARIDVFRNLLAGLNVGEVFQ